MALMVEPELDKRLVAKSTKSCWKCWNIT